ncbi:hypothetical protein HGA91_00245 [candidate division WWE3 bacterium]|nr:hypothetical protein [candidate division WWE3 bacterium]
MSDTPAPDTTAAAEKPQLTADAIVTMIGGWISQGHSSARISQYLAVRGITTDLVRQACAMIRQAVTEQTTQVAELRTQMQADLDTEESTYTSARAVQQGLLDQAQQIMAQANAVLAFYGAQSEAQPAAAEGVTQETAVEPVEEKPRWPSFLGNIFEALSVDDGQAAVEAASLQTEANTDIAQPSTPSLDDPYVPLQVILVIADLSIQTTRRWDSLRALSVDEGRTPDLDLADLQTTFEVLKPQFERGRLMAQRQAQQSQSAIGVYEAHWSQVRAQNAQNVAELDQRAATLTSFNQACDAVETMIATIEASTQA